MLSELSIFNFALIDSLNIEFNKGLNILTGETGAGKSIIIDALGLVLGQRSNRENIRQGQDRMIVEALFNVTKNKNKVNAYLQEVGIDKMCIRDSTYSLIHDDLPSMDNDDFRRGKPTNHKVFGEGMAILAGDGLLNYSYELMINNIPKDIVEMKNYIEGMKEIARAAGIMGMIGGQVKDLEYEGKDMDIDTLHYIHSHKTGALIRASLRCV